MCCSCLNPGGAGLGVRSHLHCFPGSRNNSLGMSSPLSLGSFPIFPQQKAVLDPCIQQCTCSSLWGLGTPAGKPDSMRQGCVSALLLRLFATPRTVCSPSGSSVHGISQTRIVERVSIYQSRGSSRPRDQTTSLVSPALARRFFTTESPGKPS